MVPRKSVLRENEAPASRIELKVLARGNVNMLLVCGMQD
jgi:hypothetical protein